MIHFSILTLVGAGRNSTVSAAIAASHLAAFLGVAISGAVFRIVALFGPSFAAPQPVVNTNAGVSLRRCDRDGASTGLVAAFALRC